VMLIPGSSDQDGSSLPCDRAGDGVRASLRARPLFVGPKERLSRILPIASVIRIRAPAVNSISIAPSPVGPTEPLPAGITIAGMKTVCYALWRSCPICSSGMHP